MRALLLLCAASVYGADVAMLVRQVVAYEYGKDPAAARELEALAHRSGAGIEKELLAGLGSARTVAAKDVFCRLLGIAGREASVRPLAAMLLKEETAEMARRALERIPGDRATGALREALARGASVGLVESVGRRRDSRSTEALKRLLGASDKGLAAAAATALGQIGTPAARDALEAAAASPAVMDALLAIAESDGGVYLWIGSGVVRADAKAAPLLREALKSDSVRTQAVAIRELARIDPATLVKELPTASALTGLRIVAALGDHGVFVSALSSEHDAVRIVALNGLARVGTAADIPRIAERAARASGEEQAAARAALAGIRGENVDAAMVRAISDAEARTKLELIRAAGERGIASAVEILLAAAGDSDRQVRIESIRGLRETAGVGHVAGMLAALQKASVESERREWERAIAASIRRSKDAGLPAYAPEDAVDARISLLNIYSAIGNPAAIPPIRQALHDSASEVRRAALNALSNWPTPEPLDDLLALARAAGDPARQTLALRGYIRLLGLPSGRTPAETAVLLKVALAAATRPEEKRSLLAIAQRVPCPESLAVARAALDDPQVRAEAQLAVTALERELTFLKR
jgi:HEAT repeat protein